MIYTPGAVFYLRVDELPIEKATFLLFIDIFIPICHQQREEVGVAGLWERGSTLMEKR